MIRSRYYTIAIIPYGRRANLREVYVFRTYCLDQLVSITVSYLLGSDARTVLPGPSPGRTGHHLICIAFLRGSGT